MSLNARPDWKLTPPDESLDWVPTVYIVGEDGADLYWKKKGEEDSDPLEENLIEWPFEQEETASEEDFRTLGFQVL